MQFDWLTWNRLSYYIVIRLGRNQPISSSRSDIKNLEIQIVPAAVSYVSPRSGPGVMY